MSNQAWYDYGTMDNEKNVDTRDEPEGAATTGFDELLYSLSEALRTKQSKEAIGLLLQRYAEDIPKRTAHQQRVVLWGYALMAFIFVAIGVLGYLKVITSETTGSLIGALVGAIFYGNRRR